MTGKYGRARERRWTLQERPRVSVLISLLVVAGICSSSCKAREESSQERSTETRAGSTTPNPDQLEEWRHDATRGTRPAALAGSWYPADPEDLERSVEEYLAAVEVGTTVVPAALVVPHAGHRYSGKTAAHGYATVRDRITRRVFILAPSHRVYFGGAAVPSVSFFETPLGAVPVDTEVTYDLAEHAEILMDDRPHEAEHAVEIQIPFLQVALPSGFRIVPVVIGDLDASGAERLAAALRPYVGPQDLVIASSDFTHYGEDYNYVPFEDNVPAGIRTLDMGAFEAIRMVSAAELEGYRSRTGITVCGYRAIMTLLALLPAGTGMEILDYDTSGRLTDDWQNSVSYMTIAADLSVWPVVAAPDSADGGVEVLDRREQREALRLARSVLESHVRDGETPDPDGLGIDVSGAIGDAYGVFVTLKRNGQLRGCIGNIWPEEPLAEAIVRRTVDAAMNDHRFRPVAVHELDLIDIEISVLTVPTRVESFDDIEVGRHGIVLEKFRRRAVYLPQVATEQGWNLDETLNHLAEKAGLPTDAWRSDAHFDVFEAQVFGEEHH